MNETTAPKTSMKIIQVNVDVNAFLAEAPELYENDALGDTAVDIKAKLRAALQGRAKLFDVSLDTDHQNAVIRWGIERSPQEAEIHNRNALQSARQRDFDKAVLEWHQAVAESESDPDYRYNLGLALFEQKNYIKGLDHCKEAVRICPVYYRAYFVLGSIYSKMRKFELAEEHIRKGLLFQPDNINALVNLGAIYSILKNYKAGITVFEKATSLSPKETKAYLGLGKIYNILNDYDKANRCFKVVIKLDGNGRLGAIAKNSIFMEEPVKEQDDESETIDSENVEQLYSDAYQAFLNADYERAVRSYQQYLKYQPQDSIAWSKLASAFLRTGQYEKAIETVTTAIKKDPEKSGLYKQASIIYDAGKNAAKAGEMAAKAIEFGKSDSVTLTLYGIARAKSGYVQEAVQILQKAVNHNPNNQKARFHFALLLKEIGQVDAARQHLEEILWSKNSSPLKERARQEIQAMM